MYGSCRSLNDALDVFDKLEVRNVFSWNIIINACIQNEKMDLARKLFEDSPRRDVVTWNAMITANADIGHLEDAKLCFAKMATHNVSSWNSMVALLGKNKDLPEAKFVFDSTPERNLVTWHSIIVAFATNGDLAGASSAFERMSMRTVISWNTIISACLLNKNSKAAALLFRSMPEQDAVSINSMISAHAQIGNIDEASRLFESMSDQQRGLNSWNSLIAGYLQNDHFDDASRLFDSMPTKNPVTWNTMITACAQSGRVEQAKSLYDQMVTPDRAASTSMLLAYAYRGQVEDARALFDKLPEKDVACWSAMMSAYSHNGQAEEAVKLFGLWDLEGVPLDRSCFIVILELCTSLSALGTGRAIHSCVRDTRFECEVPIANSLIGLYGKCACVGDAKLVFDSMASRNVVSWNSMMTSYSQNGFARESLELGRGLMLAGEQPDFITFINILSACSHEGLWKDGWSYFMSIEQDHELEVTLEHYHCMIDLLARSGDLQKAERLIQSMPFKADDIAWRSLLSGAQVYGDIEIGIRAAEQLVKLDLATTSEYVMLANIYLNNYMWITARDYCVHLRRQKQKFHSTQTLVI